MRKKVRTDVECLQIEKTGELQWPNTLNNSNESVIYQKGRANFECNNRDTDA